MAQSVSTSERARAAFLSVVNDYPHYDEIYVTYIKCGKHIKSAMYPMREFLDSITEFISSSQSGDGFNCYAWHLKATLLFGTEMYVVVREFYDPGMSYDDETRGLDATISTDPSILRPPSPRKMSARDRRRH